MQQGCVCSIKLVTLFCALLYCATASGVDPGLSWRSIESEHFQLHFNEPHHSVAERAITIAERSHQRLSQELNWTPAEKTHLVLSDESDYANGFATVFNFNRSVLYMAPPSGVGGLEDFDDWLDLLITHEYTHILHLDKADGAPRDIRAVLGRFLLLFPNVFEPPWIVEGLATYKETDNGRGVGRGQSRLFEMMMRMEVEQGIKPVSQINLPISTWPAGATRYLYGVYFMHFVTERYGEAKLRQFIAEYSDNLMPFLVNTTFKKVFRKNLTEMWQEYELWLNEKFQPQITKLKQQVNVEQAIQITRDGYINQPVRAVGENVYYIRSDGSYQPELVKRSASGEIQVLAEVHNNADFDVSPQGKIIISQPEVCDEYSIYSDLYIYSEERLKRITRCGRYQRAIWNKKEDALIAVHHAAGQYELHQLSTNGELVQKLWQAKQNEILSQIDIAPDGRQIVAAVWRETYGWNIELFDLEILEWTAITQNTVIQAYPVFSADGKSIFYSSEAEGVYNLYRYDLDTQTHHQLSHLLGGGFQSTQGEVAGPLYYVGYSARGNDIYKLVDTTKKNETPLSSTQRLKSLAATPKNYTSQKYTPWQSVQPRWWFPQWLLDDERSELGFTTAGNDALGVHNYALTAVYDFENTAPSGSALYLYSNKFALSLSRENNIYKNASGIIDRVRADETLQIIYQLPNTGLLSSSNILMALSWERDRDIELSNGAVPVRELNDNLAGFAWLYNNARVYPLSISPGDGRRLRLIAEDNETLSSDFNGQTYTLDWREYLRLGGEHVLSLRLLQAWGTDQPAEFRLGGEDNGNRLSPWLETSGEGVFARREYALRGYAEGLPQLRGRRAQLLSAEYRFPIQRLERGIMAPPLGLMQWYGKLFIDSGAAYNGRRPETYFTGAGVELSADLNLFYLIPMIARLGYAHGFDEIGENRAYISLGASF